MSYKEARTVFGAWVRERRRAHGLDQAGLAQVLGVSSGAVSKWEMGSNVPSSSIRKHLHDLFGPGPLEKPMPVPQQVELPVPPQPAKVAPQPVTAAKPSPQPVMASEPVTQAQGVLPVEVQAIIDGILRMPWQAQKTVVQILRLSLEKEEYEKRLIHQLAGGGRS